MQTVTFSASGGLVHRYGDDVNTDVIIPARYLNICDPVALAAHCMEDIDPAFAGTVRKGDVLVAGERFGCGSSREHAPLAIQAAGIAFVVAKSFARIFYRNAMNIGLPIVTCAQADRIVAGDRLSLDPQTGVLTNHTAHETYATDPFPPFMRTILQAGGLLAALAREEAIADESSPDHSPR